MIYLNKYNAYFFKFKYITVSKCYDEETKTAYKVDSIWYPKGKCEKRTCSRKYDSKTPVIKTEE